MTFGDLREFGYKYLLGNFETMEKARLEISKCEYLWNLADSFRIDMRHWPYDTSAYLPEFKELTAHFLKLKEENQASPRLTSELARELKKKLVDYSYYWKNKQKSYQQATIDYEEAEIKSLHKTIKARERNIRAIMAAMNNEEETRNIIAEIEAINEAGFFSFHGFEKKQSFLSFVSEPVILNDMNRAAKLKLTVNLGRFFLRICPLSLKFYLYPFQNNTPLGSSIPAYYHPHFRVRKENGACWGRLDGEASETRKKGDLVGYLALLQKLMNSYNKENPYAPLYQFKKAQEDRQIALALKHGATIPPSLDPLVPLTAHANLRNAFPTTQISAMQRMADLHTAQAIQYLRSRLSVEETGSLDLEETGT